MANMTALLDRHFIDGELVPPLMGRWFTRPTGPSFVVAKFPEELSPA
jgi:hypothetical protein